MIARFKLRFDVPECIDSFDSYNWIIKDLKHMVERTTEVYSESNMCRMCALDCGVHDDEFMISDVLVDFRNVERIEGNSYLVDVILLAVSPHKWIKLYRADSSVAVDVSFLETDDPRLYAGWTHIYKK